MLEITHVKFLNGLRFKGKPLALRSYMKVGLNLMTNELSYKQCSTYYHYRFSYRADP